MMYQFAVPIQFEQIQLEAAMVRPVLLKVQEVQVLPRLRFQSIVPARYLQTKRQQKSYKQKF